MANKWLTFKFPMQIIAIIVIALLIGATITYFYDTLAAAFNKLTWFYKPLANHLAFSMASIIGLGVLAESAATIWDKLIYWGQCLDNKIIYYRKHKKYFIDQIEYLLEKTRMRVNQTNLALQTLTLPADSNEEKNKKESYENYEKLHKHYCQIKLNCEKMNKLILSAKAEDKINQIRLERAKNLLNMLVMENLHISDRIERFIP